MPEHSTVLITGGAGYIGSHAVFAFQAAGYPVVVLDDLSNGRRDVVPKEIPFVRGYAGDLDLVGDLIRTHRIGAVAHFAGSIVVPESVADPLKYYRNNTSATRNLIQVCVEHSIRRFIFSSTAAVYGIPESIPVREDTPTAPINPYGTSKLMIEWMLRDAAAAHDLKVRRPALFQCRGGGPGGQEWTELGLRHTPHRSRQSGRAGPARALGDLRGRLRYARWHLHPGLHPRLRSGRRACSRVAPPPSGRHERRVQPGERTRLFRPRSRGGRTPRDRAAFPHAHRAAPCGGPAPLDRRRLCRSTGLGLAADAVGTGYPNRRRLALDAAARGWAQHRT